MNAEPEIISRNRISLSRAKRRTESKFTTHKPPEGSIENDQTPTSNLREFSQLSPTSESPIMIVDAGEQEPVVSPKSNKKIVSIRPQKITISRTQSKSPVMERELSTTSPMESPINFPKFDGLSSPSKSPMHFRFLDGEFLTEGDLLLSRNSSIPSPIGKNILSVNFALDDTSLLKTLSKTSNQQEYAEGEQGYLMDTPISQIGSIMPPYTTPDTLMIEKYRVPHKKSQKKRDNILVLNEVNNSEVPEKGGRMRINGLVLSDEECKESPSLDPNRTKQGFQGHNDAQNSPLNLDKSGLSDIRMERDISSNNIRADTFDSPDVSHVNANNIANQTADVTATAILINNNNNESNANPTVTPNNQQQTGESPTQNNSPTQRRTHYIPSDYDIKLYLRKNIEFFLACAIGSLLYYYFIKGQVSYHTIFITGYIYFASQVFENFRSACLRTASETWQQKEDLLNTIIVLGFTLAALIIHLKFENIISVSVFGATPPFASLIIYMAKTNGPKEVLRSKIATLLFLGLEIFLITLKLDKVITAGWDIVFLLCWGYLGAIIVFLIAYAFFTLFLLLTIICRIYEPDTLGLFTQLAGLIWHIAYFGLSVAAVIITIGMSEAYQEKGTFDKLTLGLIVAISMNGFLVIYTLIVKKQVAQFIKVYSINSMLVEQESEAAPKKTKIKFQVEKKASYFVMLSSTYFLPLNHELLGKNKRNLERVRKIQSMFKLANGSPRNQKKVQEDVTNNPISIQTLHGYKEKLDETIDRISKINPFQIDETIVKSPKTFRILSARFPEPSPMTDKESDPFSIKIARSNSKLNLSADNLGNLQIIDVSPQQEQSGEDENLCYLCYERVPDAVLMNCGHGGICYECAIASIKTKNECVECRAQVVAIHKVDPNPKLVDVIKSLECSKIVIEQEP